MNMMISNVAAATDRTSALGTDIARYFVPVADGVSPVGASANAIATCKPATVFTRTRLGRTDDRMSAGVPALGAHPFVGTEQGSPPRGEPR